MKRQEAINAAMGALANGERLTTALCDVYDAGYREGDLDRLRFQACEVKRKPRKARVTA